MTVTFLKVFRLDGNKCLFLNFFIQMISKWYYNHRRHLECLFLTETRFVQLAMFFICQFNAFKLYSERIYSVTIIINHKHHLVLIRKCDEDKKNISRDLETNTNIMRWTAGARYRMCTVYHSYREHVACVHLIWSNNFISIRLCNCNNFE